MDCYTSQEGNPPDVMGYDLNRVQHEVWKDVVYHHGGCAIIC